MKLPAKGTEERAWFVNQMLNDTGFFCRNVLGMDTDRDPTGEPVSEVGKGGVRDHGPHADTIRFMDDEGYQYKVLWTPRFTYKSSKVTGYILRNILRYPDISILLAMHATKEAESRIRTMRDILTTNEIILELFGDVKGPVWADKSFVSGLRQDKTLLTPTLYGASPEKGTAGGRPDLIVFDDVVSEKNSVTDEQLAKGRRFVEATLALRGQRTRYLMVGTPYHEADANHWAIDAGWHKCVHLDVGVDVAVNERGFIELSGEARWPNLPIDFLRKYLKREDKQGGGGSYEWFMSQFKLQVVRGLRAMFARHHFQPCSWQNEEHSDLTGYLLTDVAPSGAPNSDLNVLLYIGIDARDRIHLLDLEIGHWQMFEFADRYLKMLQRWQRKVNHRLEVWEKSCAYHSYHQYIHARAREQNVRVQFHAEQRNNTTLSKDGRIGSCAIDFQSHNVFVMDTMPRYWNAPEGPRELWNPSGEIDHKTGFGMPSGDLVLQFVRWPVFTKKDIPDAYALSKAIDKETKRMVCCYVKSARRRSATETERKPVRPTASKYHGSTSRFYGRVAGTNRTRSSRLHPYRRSV